MMNEINQHNLMNDRSRFFCHIGKTNAKMFFNLVAPRNNNFTGNDPNKIIEFYNGLENRDQFIKFMKERRNGVRNIHEVEGVKEISVVIPTADFNYKCEKECSENIFKGIQTVFVVDSGRGDFHFNIVHNTNVRMKKAMICNPKFLVVSNNDIMNGNPISKLGGESQKIEHKNTYAIFTPPAPDHSTHSFLGISSLFFIFALKVLKIISKRFRYIKNTYFHMRRLNKQSFFQQYEDIPALSYRIVNSFFFKRIETFINTFSFGNFSSNFVREYRGNLLNGTYINEMEDTDLSMRVKCMNHNLSIMESEINEYVCSTLRSDDSRTIRGIIGWTYFYYEMKMEVLTND